MGRTQPACRLTKPGSRVLGNWVRLLRAGSGKTTPWVDRDGIGCEDGVVVVMEKREDARTEEGE